MKIFNLLLFTFLLNINFQVYTQDYWKIKPSASLTNNTNLPYPYTKWGYKDLLNDWVIRPKFVEAYSFDKEHIAIVRIKKNNAYYNAFIDLNGDILLSYKSTLSEKQINKKYEKALKLVTERHQTGLYNNVISHLVKVDAVIKGKKLEEKARKDSIMVEQKKRQMRADSIANAKQILDSISNVKRILDSVWLAKLYEINVESLSEGGISIKKIKISGDKLLLLKDENYRTYEITRDDYNRYIISHDGDLSIHGVLDVVKVVYESDWNLLSDDLFHKIEITKSTAEISRGTRKQKYGLFTFLITLNISDLDLVKTNEETLIMVLTSISQVEKFMKSFMSYYQSASNFVEPLFQVEAGGMEGIKVGIVDKQDKGASMADVKNICKKAKQEFNSKRGKSW